ncbi:MAG TPA: hypothetical protein PKO06_05810, partial [Candidatus Ozemobacteraceae bacterium]|nr:hypothetical protein [Candidatus Ozemobacteraceae bacterium]
MAYRRGWVMVLAVVWLGLNLVPACSSQRPTRTLTAEPEGGDSQVPQSKLVELVKVTRVKANLRGIARHVDGSIWAVGYDGVIVRLDANLNTVATIPSGVKVPLFDISFIDEKTGFIVGGSAQSMDDPKK